MSLRYFSVTTKPQKTIIKLHSPVTYQYFGRKCLTLLIRLKRTTDALSFILYTIYSLMRARIRAFLIMIIMTAPQLEDLCISGVEEYEIRQSEINDQSFEKMSVPDSVQRTWPSPSTTPSGSSANSSTSSDKSSIIQYQDKREQLNSRLQLAWTENIRTGSNILPLYEKVAVLLISWDCDDLNTADEVFDS